jgi:hypothetical protein
MRIDRLVTFCTLALAIAASPTRAGDENGFLTVNDEDYGYWEGRPMVLLHGDEVPIDEVTGRHSELTFELEHDLAQGLVRQYTRQRQGEGAATPAGGSVSEAAGVASGTTPTEPPAGAGEWVHLYRFASFGFGLYQDGDATHSAYCAHGPEVWAWLSTGASDRSSPDEVADLLIRDGNGMARLKFSCERPIELTQ